MEWNRNLAHNKLIGSIPTSIADLANLQYADLSYNKLSGTLPKNLKNLTHLFSFNVSYNNLKGELPIGEIGRASCRERV